MSTNKAMMITTENDFIQLNGITIEENSRIVPYDDSEDESDIEERNDEDFQISETIIDTGKLGTNAYVQGFTIIF